MKLNGLLAVTFFSLSMLFPACGNKEGTMEAAPLAQVGEAETGTAEPAQESTAASAPVADEQSQPQETKEVDTN